MKKIPEIRSLNGIPTMFVNDRPFFAKGGEIHNSSSSDLKYMAEQVWPNLEGLNMNCVVVPIFWETIEPVEGEYDFTLLDGVVEEARKRGMHLILLWFGLWKNSESSYVPGWIKTEPEIYFLARDVFGCSLPIISPLCEAAVEKDARAFSKVMAHIRETDSEQSTVIMMQVENEIGILGAERDYGEAAEKIINGNIPDVLEKGLAKTGTWKEAFGEDADESFMAWAYASAVEKITSAGQREYPIPCYANSWLCQYPWYPDSYPVGGPVPKVHPIWRLAAPSLCGFGPDIYVPYVPQIMDEYHRDGNPLIIPEVRKDAVASSYCLYAFLHHDAICFSPFGIEELALSEDAIDKPSPEIMAALNIDPSAFEIQGSFAYLSETYRLMENIEPLYLEYRGTEKLKSFVRYSETDFGTFLKFSQCDIAVSYSPRMTAKPVGSGAVFQTAEDEFLLVGMMCSFTFRPKPGRAKKIGYLNLEEGVVENGKFVPGRILNGDERMKISCGDHITCIRAKIYQY